MAAGAGADRRVVFRGNLISVEVRSHRYREIVHHPGSCAAVPLTSRGTVLLVRQHREAIEADSLEIPAGTRDIPGEGAAECAAREVLEETGHRVTRLERLGSIHPSPGFLDERVELFVAQVEPAGEPEEGLTVVELPFQGAVAAVRDGRITDAKTAVGLLLVAG